MFPRSSSQPDSIADSRVPRRGLLLGAGASVLAAATLGAAQSASAASPNPGHGSSVDHAHPEGTTVTAGIGSAPIAGYTYRYAGWADFNPESGARSWGGSGMYSSGTASSMHAFVDIPAGARVRDIEWYIYNTAAVTALCRLWKSGNGFLSDVLGDLAIPAGSSIAASRIVIPDTANGPFPMGTKLSLVLATPTDGSVQINGARVGFDHGAAASGILATPARAYDSRQHSKLAANTKRVITLPVKPGTTGVILNVTTLSASGSGALKVWAGNGAAPSVTTQMAFPKSGSGIEQLTVPVSTTGQITLSPNHSTHVVVDLVGTIG